METLEEIIAIVEAKLPGWEWLVRKDNLKGGWFANLMTPDFANGITIVEDGNVITPKMIGRTYPCWSSHSAARALKNSMRCVDPFFYEPGDDDPLPDVPF